MRKSMAVVAMAAASVGLAVGWSALSEAPAQDKPAAGPPAAKWEYKTFHGLPNDATFNKLGDEGWELAGTAVDARPNTASSYYHVFKRPKR